MTHSTEAIKIELKEEVNSYDFPHKDIPILYELMRKEKFILIQGTIIRVKDIKKVDAFFVHI